LPFLVLVSLNMPFKHPLMAQAFFPECLSSHCQGLRHTFRRLAQNLMLFLRRIQREIAWDQIHKSK
jgi:hypothetical protein